MHELPKQQDLSIQLLSSSFIDTTNSYKFYWLWSILDTIQHDDVLEIDIDELSLRMISLVWYPLDYYKISFGKQDSFKTIASLISNNINIDSTANSADLYTQIKNHPNQFLIAGIKTDITKILKRWVVYRFIRPFFYSELKSIPDQKVNKAIKELSNLKIGYAPYRIGDGKIILDSNWRKYLSTHQSVLRGFIKWHLLKFLQKNNSTVIGLSEKIEKPPIRNLSIAKRYWLEYLKSNTAKCIYKGHKLNSAEISLDHFIPWSYVVHDQLWNIIPTTKATNSMKSNSLPSLKFFKKFCNLQYEALQYHLSKGNFALIEDFYSLTKCDDLSTISYTIFKEKLLFEVTMNLRNAKNLGFTNYFS